MEEKFNYWINKISNEKIEELRTNLIDIFAELDIECFKREEDIGCIVSTMGYATALHKTLIGTDIEKDFFEWYDSLEYYDSDDFDGLIGDRLLLKSDI